MKEIDVRGLAGPAPVQHVKDFLEEEGPAALRVVVDNAASQQNVQRFLESRGFETRLEQAGSDYLVVGTPAPPPGPSLQAAGRTRGETAKIMVMCCSDRLGSGDDELGARLMVNFLRTLKEMGDDLWRLVFVNNGVKLTVADSIVFDDLSAYEAEGLTILVCTTCLGHFDLLEARHVGETTNMLDIVTAMQLADRVITI